MGTYNFTSTLIALIAADCKRITGNHVESSEDFIHFVYTNTQEELFQQSETLRRLFKMVVVNVSSAKAIMISPMVIGEFNSKYHFLDFVGNVATELPVLVLVGSNSSTDLGMGLNTNKNALVTFQMLFPIANLAFKLFIKAYRHACIVEGVTKRTQFMEKNKIEKLILHQGAELES